MKISVLNVDADGVQTLVEQEVSEDFFDFIFIPPEPLKDKPPDE